MKTFNLASGFIGVSIVGAVMSVDVLTLVWIANLLAWGIVVIRNLHNFDGDAK